jgi:N-acetylmuramoyl-L-alanine amidase
VQSVGRAAALYATVTADHAWAFPNATTTGGSDTLLQKGQRDAIAAISGCGDWVRLASGLWMEKQHIVEERRQPNENVLSEGRYVGNGATDYDSIRWTAADHPITRILYNGTRLTVYFGLQTEVPRIHMSRAMNIDRTIFSAMNSGVLNGVPFYTFTLKEGARLDGYYTTYSDGVFAINLKKRRALAEGTNPLSGFGFVIDAGHGGSDTGALGPMGAAFAEKHINLINAKNLANRLTALGAEVKLTRADDTFLTLRERVMVSHENRPDMFISMHANSVAESTDATNIRGITYWYRNIGSKPLADHLMAETYNVNPLTTRNRGSNQSNFYVCRPVWSPSVIVEASFICNIDDFSWLISPARQNELADEIVRAILSYYK